MKNVKTLILLSVIATSSLHGRNPHEHPLQQLLNQMQQMHQKTFFNDPFFNDPFFSDPFGKLFHNMVNDDDESSYYIIISNDPNQQKPQQIIQQAKPQPRKPAPQQPKPHQNIPPSHGGFFPLIGQDPRMGLQGGQSTYQQYNPDTQKNQVTFDDVLGQKEAINEVSEVVDFLKHPEEYHKLGAEIPKGILLEGPPGNGKTLLARAVANEAGCTFIHASGSQFINKYVGTGADNIRKLFDQARNQAPAIIFIDEIDAIGSRERDENQEYRHTINELLTQLDGFTQEDNVIIIAATNFAKSLDKALLRPGRFDRIIKVGLPTKTGRKDILKYYMKKKQLDSSINVETLATEFAERTPGFSAAALKKLVNEAALSARRDNAKTITQKHFEQGYDKIILGLMNDLERTDEQLKRTAYHEAGHTLLKVLTTQPVAKVSILSRGDALGVTFEKEKYESTSEYQKDELMNKIMALQAGFLAEKVALNIARPGASADLEQVNLIANAMVKEFGMGTGELEGITCKGMISDEMKHKFDKEVLKLIQVCKKKSEALLVDNKTKLDKLAKELLKKETLNEEEIYKILA